MLRLANIILLRTKGLTTGKLVKGKPDTNHVVR